VLAWKGGAVMGGRVQQIERALQHPQFYDGDIGADIRWLLEQNRAQALEIVRMLTQHADDIASFERQRARLRAALVGLVGVDGKDELEQMEAVMRLTPAPAQDKAVTIDAIHALIATLQS
jgi:hypothetical protein